MRSLGHSGLIEIVRASLIGLLQVHSPN